MKGLTSVAYLVRDYDEAINWFTTCLGFKLVEDHKLSTEKRWVRIAHGDSETALLLAKAVGPEQISHVGKAAGGRVAFILHVENFDKEFAKMRSNGVQFLETPRAESYGTVAVFIDLYGNKWDLIGP